MVLLGMTAETKKQTNREAKYKNILYNKVSKGTSVVMVISQKADLGGGSRFGDVIGLELISLSSYGAAGSPPGKSCIIQVIVRGKNAQRIISPSGCWTE